MTTDPADINRYIQQIRLAFQRLRKVGETLHADLGVSLSLRAVLEWLAEHGSQTVPQVAEAKSVSRQHVQKSVDELMSRGLVRSVANPTHKRSVLIELTGNGRKLFRDMQKREAALIDAIADRSDGEAMRKALAQLVDFNAKLNALIKEVGDDSH